MDEQHRQKEVRKAQIEAKEMTQPTLSTDGDKWKSPYQYPGVRARVPHNPHQIMECENCGHRMRYCDIEEECTQKGRTNCCNEDAVEEIHEEVCPECKGHSSFIVYDGEEEDE